MALDSLFEQWNPSTVHFEGVTLRVKETFFKVQLFH